MMNQLEGLGVQQAVSCWNLRDSYVPFLEFEARSFTWVVLVGFGWKGLREGDWAAFDIAERFFFVLKAQGHQGSSQIN